MQQTSHLQQKWIDVGLLILRLGMGIMFITHGWPKLQGGPELWAKIGQSMANFGIDFAPTVWGLLAAIAETGGGVLLMLGLLFRPACFCLFATMVVAITMHVGQGDSFAKTSHAIEAGILFLSLMLIGPGKYALRLRKREIIAG